LKLLTIFICVNLEVVMNSIFFNQHDEHKSDPIIKCITDPTMAEAFAACKAEFLAKI